MSGKSWREELCSSRTFFFIVSDPTLSLSSRETFFDLFFFISCVDTQSHKTLLQKYTNQPPNQYTHIHTRRYESARTRKIIDVSLGRRSENSDSIFR